MKVVLLIFLSSVILSAAVRPIVIGTSASNSEILAAVELSTFLSEIYPGESFPAQTTVPALGEYILLGTLNSLIILQTHVSATEVQQPGSFVVKQITSGGRNLGIVCGNSPRAVLDGVYSLLDQKLGYGFYLTHNASENKVSGGFNFNPWSLSAIPKVTQRLVLNWHNFLSSCSTWELEDWKHWIRQVSRMRYTHIMIHTYDNNPLTEYTFNGEKKVVGWLSSSRKGREWTTSHVWDVTNMPGAKGVFDKPVFGSDAAAVPDDQRVAVAKNMMKEAFAYAKTRGVEVIFAYDVDSRWVAPENVRATLPAQDKFKNGECIRPDTPGGYLFYKNIVQTLLSDFPDIGNLLTWFRNGGTVWTNIVYADLPTEWQTDYDNIIAANPAADNSAGPKIYAISKITEAFEQAVGELNRSDVKIGYGTWAASGVYPAANVFMKDHWREYPLYSGNNGRDQPVTHMLWAQHDDGKHEGKPFLPPSNIGDQLENNQRSGMGVLHWMWRPLDIFFKNSMNQIWSNTLNETTGTTISRMALDYFGSQAAPVMENYLNSWINEAPQFGWSTRDQLSQTMEDTTKYNHALIDQEVDDRIRLLNTINRSSFSSVAQDRWDYFIEHERWIKGMFIDNNLLVSAQTKLAAGDLTGAINDIQAADPEATLQHYANAITSHDLTPGEKGWLVSQHTKWLNFFIEIKQSLGLERIGVNFQPTNQDSLGRYARSLFTAYYSREGVGWRGMGESETGFPAFELTGLPVNSTAQQVSTTYIESNSSFSVDIKGIRGKDIPDGNYHVYVYLPASLASALNQRVINLDMTGGGTGDVSEQIDLYTGNSVYEKIYQNVQVTQGYLRVNVGQVTGNPAISAVVVQPAAYIYTSVKPRDNNNNAYLTKLQLETELASTSPWGLLAAKAKAKNGELVTDLNSFISLNSNPNAVLKRGNESITPALLNYNPTPVNSSKQFSQETNFSLANKNDIRGESSELNVTSQAVKGVFSTNLENTSSQGVWISKEVNNLELEKNVNISVKKEFEKSDIETERIEYSEYVYIDKKLNNYISINNQKQELKSKIKTIVQDDKVESFRPYVYDIIDKNKKKKKNASNGVIGAQLSKGRYSLRGQLIEGGEVNTRYDLMGIKGFYQWGGEGIGIRPNLSYLKGSQFLSIQKMNIDETIHYFQSGLLGTYSFKENAYGLWVGFGGSSLFNFSRLSEAKIENHINVSRKIDKVRYFTDVSAGYEYQLSIGLKLGLEVDYSYMLNPPGEDDLIESYSADHWIFGFTLGVPLGHSKSK